MVEPIGDADLLTDGDLRAVAALGSVDVLVGVPARNQSRSVTHVLEVVRTGLTTALADRKSAVVVLAAGFQDETLDAVKGWAASRPSQPPVCCVRIAGPPSRSRVMLGLLDILRRLESPACALADAGLVSLTPETLRCLVQPILAGEADYVSPAYTHTVAEGTLTTNLLAPMCRALYGRRIQQLLGGCAAVSQRIAARLLDTHASPGDPTDDGLEMRLLIETLASGERIVEVHAGRKTLDAGLTPPDLATTLAQTVGPFFRLMDRYREVWSEIGGSVSVPRIGEPPSILPEVGEVQLDRMVRGFRLGLKDLLPIWEQVLQEETLGLLYPLGLLSPDEFVFPVEHWARVAVDFAVASHERRLPRGHLPRALTPLYLGRVAAFLRETQGASPARIVTALEAIGGAFEAAKPGLAARWR